MPTMIPFFSPRRREKAPSFCAVALALFAAVVTFCACPLTEAPETEGETVTLVAVSGGNGAQTTSRERGEGPRRITFMTWNAQCFFDATETGGEFEEFRGSKSEWSAERYSTRLDRLCEIVLLAGSALDAGPDRAPDVAILEEIESARVIEDLCNRLPSRARYPFAAFVPPAAGSAFATAVLSRYPILSVTAHSSEDESILAAKAILRPLIEVSLDAQGLPITVFGAHWKSKADDSDSAAIRGAQERALAARIGSLRSRDPGAFFVAAGDFNQTDGEFETLGAISGNPWPDWLARCASGEVGGPDGSYCFDGKWEAIDHYFHSLERDTGYRPASFRVLASPPLTDAEGLPSRYEVFSGKGYSDHLPLLLAFEKMN